MKKLFGLSGDKVEAHCSWGGKTERFQQYDQYESKHKFYAYMSLPYVIYLNELSVYQNQQVLLESNVFLLMPQPVFNILL